MSETVIELEDVHVRYKTRASSLFRPKYVDALAGVSLTVKRGQTCLLYTSPSPRD